MNTKHTPGPWYWSNSYRTLDNRATWSLVSEADGYGILSCDGEENSPQGIGNPENARLIAAAPTQNEEMLRYLPVLERAEADVELWERLTAGTGIATLNGYRAAIEAALSAQPAPRSMEDAVADALNVLEVLAVNNGSLSGDDVPRFHAIADRIAVMPSAQPAEPVLDADASATQGEGRG